MIIDMEAGRFCNCFGQASITIIVSFAYYWIMGKSWPQPFWIGSRRRPRYFALLTIDCRRLAARTKGSGDRGSNTSFAMKTLAWNTVQKNLRRPQTHNHLDPFHPPRTQAFQPLWRRMSTIASCSNLSKAFSKSSFNITIFFLAFLQRNKYSKEHAKQSWMDLSLIETYWFLWTSLVMTRCMGFARSFANILTLVFSRDIGL